MKQNAAGFYKRGIKRGGAGIPQVIGAVDGTHIPIKTPVYGNAAHHCRKGFPSINVHAICDQFGRLIEVLVGNPGSMHDSNVFKSNDFWRSIHNGLGSVLWRGRSLVLGTQVPFQIIADSAYACTSFVLPAFKDGVAGQDRNKKRFNRKHAATRNVVERAFGRLKTRWRALLKEYELQLKNQNFMILACFCLHNICEVRNERCPPNDAELHDLVRMYKLKFPFEQGVVGLDMDVDDGDIDEYADVAMPDPQQDVPMPNDMSAHGNRVRDAIVGFVNQRQGGSDAKRDDGCLCNMCGCSISVSHLYEPCLCMYY